MNWISADLFGELRCKLLHSTGVQFIRLVSLEQKWKFCILNSLCLCLLATTIIMGGGQTKESAQPKSRPIEDLSGFIPVPAPAPVRKSATHTHTYAYTHMPIYWVDLWTCLQFKICVENVNICLENVNSLQFIQGYSHRDYTEEESIR